ncbi:MAG TPA: Uma2 family endonuclease [Acetobacteraceae bacterium]|nr:Uma2 family endonuclease [Acetobacteraceae bacterium]
MATARKLEREWTAEAFIRTDQHEFGDLWRYELVEGRIVGHAAPSPEHGAILMGLSVALGRVMIGRPGNCRPESGSAAVSRTQQRNTARIPDALVRCGEHPRVIFEVVSPSEITHWRERDRKLRHLQAVESVMEIVELFQDDYAAHIYRRASGDPAVWTFEAVGGPDGVIRLSSLEIELGLAEIYTFASMPTEEAER